MSNVFLISGSILGTAGKPVSGVLVQAVAEKLVSETPDVYIGKPAVTNPDGQYFIRLTSSDFVDAGADILETRIQLGVYHPSGEALADTVSRFGTARLLTRDRTINIDALPEAPVSVKADLSPSERAGTLTALMTALAADSDRAFVFHLFNGLLVSQLSARIGAYLKEIPASTRALIEPALAGTDIRSIAAEAIVDIVESLFLGTSPVIEGVDAGILKAIEDISSSRISLSVAEELGWNSTVEGNSAVADFIQPFVSEPASFAIVKSAAGLSEETYSVLKQASLNLEYPSSDLLDILVDQERITVAERKAVLLSAALREFLGDHPALIAAAMSSNASAISPGDLATKTQAYWKGMLEANSHALLPAGKDASEFAAEIVAAFEKRYGREIVLHRSFVSDKSASVALLTSELASEIASSFQYIHGRKVVTVPSQSSGGGEAMRTSGTPTDLMTMASVLNRYRHLGLADVAIDEGRSVAQRKTEILDRLNAFATFYANNGDQSLLSARILTDDAEGVDWTGVDEAFKSNIRKQVMAVQRTYALGGTPAAVDSLASAGLDSALDITRLGKAGFKASVDLEEDEADRVYANAERMAYATLNLIESYRVILDSEREHTSVESSERRKAYQNLLKDMDGYSDLFGALNGCDADDCQTVLSPAAYFVDLMRFVDEHFTPLLEGHVFGEDQEALSTFISLQARRPDLWSLPLNCENTKELVPYLQIAVEVLEAYLPKVTSIFTSTSDPYQYLAGEADSFGAPVSVPNQELQLYLEHFKSNSYEVFTTIAPAQKGSDKAWRLALGLTKNQFERLTVSQGDNICKFFGLQPIGGSYPTGNYIPNPQPPQGNTNRGMANYPMAAFLKRTRITRDEFLQLLHVTSIPNEDLSYTFTGTALESGEEFILGLENRFLAENVYRWIKLSRATSLSIPDLDTLLNALASVGVINTDDPQFSAPLLRALARALRIRDRLKLSIEETATMIGYMPHSITWDTHRDTGKDAPLCDRLFRSDKLFGTNNDGAASLNINAIGLPQTSYIMSALGVSEGELFTLLQYMGQNLKAVSPAENAAVARKRVLRVFTQLFRYALLSRKLELPINSLLALLRCAGYTNLFGTTLPTTPEGGVAAMDALLSVLDLVEDTKASSISIADASYVLLDQTDAAHPEPCVIDDARKVFETAYKLRGTGENRLKNALADKMGVSRPQMDYLLTFCPQGVHLIEVGAKLPPPPPLIPVDSESNGGYETGRTMDSGKDQYTLGGDIGPNIDDQPISFNRQDGFFEADTEGITVYEIHETPTLVNPRTSNGKTEVFVSSEVLWAQLQIQKAQVQLFSIMKELYTFQWFCKKLKINPNELATISENKQAFGLSNVADLRYQDLIRIEQFKKYFDGKIEVFTNLCKSITKTGDKREVFYIQPLAELMKKEQMLVSTSDALLSVSGAFSGGLIFRIVALERIVALAQKLGISAGVLLSVIAKDDDHADIVEARDTALELFKAKYPDETVRTAVLNTYATRILTWKRDAICEYILNWADSGWLNLNTMDDIYAHLLLDVEVTEAVMTSRLVCAISSVQLYVQRCLLFLETMKDGVGIVPQNNDQYKSWVTASQEWEWRKNYRVWEANRKVFLYPENFLEPDLRDDKTPLFKTFEDAVAQQKITEDTAEAAYMDYMHGLSRLGNMVYIGAYKTGIDKTSPLGTYYLMAKSGGDPKKLYYRTLKVGNIKNRGDWGPWLEIPANADPVQMSAIEYRQDVFFFWMTLVEMRKTELGTDGSSGATTLSYTKTLHWISYNIATKKWTQQQKQDLPTEPLAGDDYSLKLYENHIKHDLYVYPVVNDSGLYVMHYGQQHLKIRKATGANTFNEVGDMNGITMKYDLYSNAFHRVWISNHNTQYYGGVTKASEADPGQPEFFDNPEFYMRPNVSLFKPASMTFAIRGLNGQNDVYPFQTVSRLYLTVSKNQDLSIYRFMTDPVFGEAMFAGLDLEKVIFESDRRQIGVILPELSNQTFKSFDVDYRVYNNIGGINSPQYRTEREKLVSQGLCFLKSALLQPNQILSQESYYSYWLPKKVIKINDSALNPQDKPWMLPTGNFSLGNLFYCNGNFYLTCLTEFFPNRYFLRLNSPSIGILESEIGNGLVNFLTLDTQQRAAAPVFDPAIQYDEWGPLFFTPPLHLPQFGRFPSIERVDTIYTGHLDFGDSYGNYFQELFLHMPWYLASRLNAEGKYKEAKDWYEKIFDPTKKESLQRGTETGGTIDQSPAQNWIYVPFREMYDSEGGNRPAALQSLYQQILSQPEAEEAYRSSPFSPYAIARVRHTALAKSIVMRYIDNLLDWGDSLFTRDTTESVNEAMMLYILANQILGDRPYSTGACKLANADYVTYEDIDSEVGADEFFYTIESDLTLESGGTIDGPSGDRGVGSSLGVAEGIFNDSAARIGSGADRRAVFGIPKNLEFYGYWDRVSDRLFKIRNSMNIDGVRRQLALFAPPIDPRMLIRLRAAGMTLDDALSLNSQRTPYRFTFMLEKAKQYTQTVQSFGGALLSALEKKDAEELQLLRSVHEQNLLQLTLDVKKKQVEVAQNQLDGLLESKANVEQRRDYYGRLIENGLTGWERTQQVSKHLGTGLRAAEFGLQVGAAAAKLAPSVGSPFAFLYGKEIGASIDSMSRSFGILSTIANEISSSAGLEATFQRRAEEWKQQKRTAEQELRQMEKQILASEVQLHIAEQELVIHQKNMDQADELELLYKDKFTNLGLYTYLATKLQKLYREAYGMAVKMAYDAQEAYVFERDEEERKYILSDNFSTERVGLLAGEALLLQLQQMEMAYLSSNKRTMEVSQTFSLASLFPAGLLKLQETGKCEFTIPEEAFDLLYPGQYKRLIKGVRVTVPCVVGPYTNVPLVLRLLRSYTRTDPSTYKDVTVTSNEHKVPTLVPVSQITSIATSQGQYDGGMFEFNFRDERYLPFENAGAVSHWSLELPEKLQPFDYSTISDVLLHISYSAKEDGVLRDNVTSRLHKTLIDQIISYQGNTPTKGLYRLISLKESFPDAYHQLSLSHTTDLQITASHFPLFLKGEILELGSMTVLVRGEGVNGMSLTATITGTETSDALASTDGWSTFAPDVAQRKFTPAQTATPVDPRNSYTVTTSASTLAAAEDILLLVNYTVKAS